MRSMEEIMKAAEAVQSQLEGAQARLDAIEVEGVSGGGMVKVRASAKGRVTAVDIDPSLLTPGDKDMLEDLVVAAFNDARGKADQVSGAEMQKMTAGLPLPAGFKLPF